MSSLYGNMVVQKPTKGIVLEDNIWEFGKPKEKAKINIVTLLPLQEPSEITKVVNRKSNSGIEMRVVERTLNYVEMYLPDSIYTYPTVYEIENEKCTIRGASKENPKRTEENGETKDGLVRIVKKNTQLMLIFIDGIAIESNIRILGKFDDFDPEKNEADESRLLSLPEITISSGKRNGTSSNPNGSTGSRATAFRNSREDNLAFARAKNSSSSTSKLTKISAIR